MANIKNHIIGVWRSLVARLTGGQEAMGSSPVTPTTNFAECIHSVHSVFYIRSTCARANVETDIKTSTQSVPKFVKGHEPTASTKTSSFLTWHERSEYHTVQLALAQALNQI